MILHHTHGQICMKKEEFQAYRGINAEWLENSAAYSVKLRTLPFHKKIKIMCDCFLNTGDGTDCSRPIRFDPFMSCAEVVQALRSDPEFLTRKRAVDGDSFKRVLLLVNARLLLVEEVCNDDHRYETATFVRIIKLH